MLNELIEALSNGLVIHRGGGSYVVYKADEVDQDEYDLMKRMIDKARKGISGKEADLKRSFVSKDTKGNMESLAADKRMVKDWDEKIEPWMSGILKGEQNA